MKQQSKWKSPSERFGRDKMKAKELAEILMLTPDREVVLVEGSARCVFRFSLLEVEDTNAFVQVGTDYVPAVVLGICEPIN